MSLIFYCLSLRRIMPLMALSCLPFPVTTYAQSEENPSASAGSSFKDRFERLKKEILTLKTETDQDLRTIESLKETMSCLDVVHHTTTSLTRRLSALGTRGDEFSFAKRAGLLVSEHQVFFDALDDFSKISLTLVKNPDGSAVADNARLQDVLEKVALSVAELASRFEFQARKEEANLGELSAQIVELSRAIYEAESSMPNVERCAPALKEKTQKLIADAKTAVQTLGLSRSLIATLQKKRALFLGAYSTSLQNKIAAQLAHASGQTADALISAIHQTLAELQLRTEVERWWSKEVLESGPARGFLLGYKSHPQKAAETLTLAIATTDAYIISAKEQRAEATSTRAQNILSSLEASLYQRRAALSNWLSLANRSLQNDPN